MITRYLVSIKDWSYFKLNVDKGIVTSLEKGETNLTDTNKDLLKRWSREELNRRQLVEIKDINELPLSLITSGNCLLDNEEMKRQFIKLLREKN